MPASAPRGESAPYGWAVEYGTPDHRGRLRVSVLLVSEGHDEAGALKRAADLHGVLVTLIADRRKQQ